MRSITLTKPDGARLVVEGRTAAMVALLVSHQAEINRHGEGRVEVHFGKGRVVLHIHATMAAASTGEGAT